MGHFSPLEIIEIPQSSESNTRPEEHVQRRSVYSNCYECGKIGLCRPMQAQETHVGNTMYGKKNKQREFSENRMVKINQNNWMNAEDSNVLIARFQETHVGNTMYGKKNKQTKGQRTNHSLPCMTGFIEIE